MVITQLFPTVVFLNYPLDVPIHFDDGNVEYIRVRACYITTKQAIVIDVSQGKIPIIYGLFHEFLHHVFYLINHVIYKEDCLSVLDNIIDSIDHYFFLKANLKYHRLEILKRQKENMTKMFK